MYVMVLKTTMPFMDQLHILHNHWPLLGGNHKTLNKRWFNADPVPQLNGPSKHDTGGGDAIMVT